MLPEEEVLYDTGSWYLVQCQTRKEAYAASSLRHLLKLPVFLPESEIRSRGVVKHVPFFPRYIFTHADFQKLSRSSINTCPGVLRLVEFGGSPQPVPQCVIETISQRIKDLNEQPLQTGQTFMHGDRVRVKYGPLQDLEMVFVRSTLPGKRVHVLLELLGRLKEIQVDATMLEKVPAKR